MNSKKFYPKNIFDSTIYNTKSLDLTIYRLTINRTFKNPVVIRVDVKKNEYNLNAINPSGAGVPKPDAIEKEISKTLSVKEIQEIEDYIEKMDFWNLNKNEERLFPGLDGSHCIFELYDKIKKYHVIDRWEPWHYAEKNKYYIELINYLLNLADINVPEVKDTRNKVKNIAKKLD